jgi:hypothetical protein
VAGCSDVAELAREEGFIARKASEGETFFVAALLRMTTKGKKVQMQDLKAEAGMARERQSPDRRVQKRHSGEWRSQGRQRKANGEERSLVAALCRDDNERLEAGAGGWWLGRAEGSWEQRRER